MPPSGQYNVFELSTTSTVAIAAAQSVASSTAATIASVIATTSGGLLLASNTSRKGVIAYSCAGSAAPALIAYTTGWTSSNFTFSLTAGAYWEMPLTLSVLGLSVGISTANPAATATIQLTELS